MLRPIVGTMEISLHCVLLALGWGALTLVILMILAYRRAGLAVSTLSLGALTVAYWGLWDVADVWKIIASIPVFLLVLLNLRPLRVWLITRPFLKAYLRMLPAMSSTEREALEAGTVWWDGELFTGGPDWNKLMAARAPELRADERAFLDGPCERLCEMLDDWDITHRRGDLPPEVWEFLKSAGFFAMIIPKRYGGLEFSAYGHSCVLVKVSS